MEENNFNDNKVHTQTVRAGKRTYYFDVKSTKKDDYCITITEKRKKYGEEFVFEKSKIFLYKEDFNKFLRAMNKSINYVKEELLPEYDFTQFDRNHEDDGDNMA